MTRRCRFCHYHSPLTAPVRWKGKWLPACPQCQKAYERGELVMQPGHRPRKPPTVHTPLKPLPTPAEQLKGLIVVSHLSDAAAAVNAAKDQLTPVPLLQVRDQIATAVGYLHQAGESIGEQYAGPLGQISGDAEVLAARMAVIVDDLEHLAARLAAGNFQ